MRRHRRSRGFGDIQSCVDEEVRRESGAICEFLFALARKANQIGKESWLSKDEQEDWRRLGRRISAVYGDECTGAPQR